MTARVSVSTDDLDALVTAATTATGRVTEGHCSSALRDQLHPSTGLASLLLGCPHAAGSSPTNGNN
jgi:hypothetical protein